MQNDPSNASSRRKFVSKFAALFAGGAALLAARNQGLAGVNPTAPRTPSRILGGTAPYLGEICMFAGNFAPYGWALCNGQLMAIQQNTALFSILGTMYGGDGRVTFGLPNLQGYAPIGAGQSLTGTYYDQGEMLGSPSETLITSEMPYHTHPIVVSSNAGTGVKPAGAYLAANAEGNNQFATSSYSAQMNAASLSPSGSSLPHNNMQPYLAINFIIATQGIFPTRA